MTRNLIDLILVTFKLIRTRSVVFATLLNVSSRETTRYEVGALLNWSLLLKIYDLQNRSV